MENSIISEINIAIQISSENFEENELIKLFENANKEYELLVEKGLTKKRGYNLLSITDIHLHRLDFNFGDENAHNIRHTAMQGYTANF